ncbi:flagellin [Citricoccus sp. GCM10030269]|uniref:flagellin N-terminal helical domain-containing protein n=1 Tax=Citricoccus sp. GCM10030269 TaxID=3273388 RepID=UPI003607A3B3
MTVINTNIAANNTYRQMNLASESAASSMEKLSSGLRINRAADDAAGLSIAEGLKAQSNGLEVAARNAGDAVSLIQTAEGGLSSAHEILQRVRDLAVQAGNDSNNADARTAIDTEIKALGEELGRMAESITFNGISLLNGASGPAGDGQFSFQVGANATNDQITLDLTAASLTDVAAAVSALDVTTAAAAATSITAVDTQIAYVSTARSDLGATQNRLEQTIKHVNISAENLTAAESSIRDVDMAKEMVELSASNIKQQASQAMLAQANQSTQGVLQLLR